jgi:hypothetical protein
MAIGQKKASSHSLVHWKYMKKGQREELSSDRLSNIGTIEAMDRTAGQAELILQCFFKKSLT